jgi:hypothetical protein
MKLSAVGSGQRRQPGVQREVDLRQLEEVVVELLELGFGQPNEVTADRSTAESHSPRSESCRPFDAHH